MGFLFEKLHAYQEGLRIAEQIVRIKSNRRTGAASLLDQLQRAAASVPANLAEGSGRYHPNEKKQFYRIARGSANECVPHLFLARAIGLLSDEEFFQIRTRLVIVGKMITRLIESVDRKVTAKGVNGH